MSSTTNQTSSTDKQPYIVHWLCLVSSSVNTQQWKVARKAFTRRGAEEKIQEAAAAENTGVHREASKVPTEANKDTVAKEVPGVVAAEKLGVPMESSKVPTEANKGTEAEEVPGVAAAEKTGVPMEASTVPTEANKGTEAEEVAGVAAQMGRCRRYTEKGNHDTQCTKTATVRPYSGVRISMWYTVKSVMK